MTICSKPVCLYPTILLTVLGLLCLSVTLSAEEAGQLSKSTESRIEIPELGAVIVAGYDGPRVKDVSPPGARLEKYQTVDLQSGDVIMAANGTRLKSIAELQELLSAVPAGEKVKLAIQRSRGLRVVQYEVATQAELASAADKAADYVEVKTVSKMISPGGAVPHGAKTMMFKAEEGSVPFIELGVILDDTSGEVVVSEVIELPPQLTPPVKLQAGDILQALQGEPVTRTEDLMDRFAAIDEGAEVVLTLTRGDAEEELVFDKPMMQGKPIRMMKKR